MGDEAWIENSKYQAALRRERKASATIERQRQALERIALTKFAGPASIDPVAILQEIARAALSEGDSKPERKGRITPIPELGIVALVEDSEGDSGCTCLRRVDGLGNPTGIRRDPVCPVHGDLARASVQVKVEGDSK